MSGLPLALLLLFPSQITRPISELTRGIVEIAHRNYSKRLHFYSTREFNEVATSFNDMAERLEEYQQSSLATLLSSKKYLEAIVNSIHEPIIGLNHDRQILFREQRGFDRVKPQTGTDDSPICRRVIVEERLVTPPYSRTGTSKRKARAAKDIRRRQGEFFPSRLRTD